MPEPFEELVSNGDMETGTTPVTYTPCGGSGSVSVNMPTGWTSINGCLSNLAGTNVMMVTSPPNVHAGQRSLKVEAMPGDCCEETVGAKWALPGTYPVGHYELSCWAKVVAHSGSSFAPQITLVAESQIASVIPTGSAWRSYGIVLNNQTSDASIYVYARFQDGSGILYLDDVSVRKVDGALINVQGKTYFPAIRPSASSWPVSSSAYELRRPFLSAGIDPRMSPARIFRRPGGAIDVGSQVLISYDQVLPTGFTQEFNIAARNVINDVYKEPIRRLVKEGFANVGAQPSVILPMTEFKGYNRTGLNRQTGASTWGRIAFTNAKRAATFTNSLIDSALAMNAATLIYVPSDEYSSRHNGGNGNDQVRYLGLHGLSSNVITTASTTDSTLRKTARVLNWWYYPRHFSGVSRSTEFFNGRGYATIQAAWYDTLNMTEVAAVSKATSGSLGGMAAPSWCTTGACPAGAPTTENDERPFIVAVAERFWNTPWVQRGFWDLNPQFAPVGVTASGGATVVDTGADSIYAIDASIPQPGKNRGGVKVASSAGTITTPYITADPNLSYGFVVTTQDSLVGIAPTPRWKTIKGDSTYTGTATLVAKTVDYEIHKMVHRVFRLNRDVVSAPRGDVRVELAVTPCTSGGCGPVTVDDLALWESLPRCKEDDVNVSVTPSSIYQPSTGPANFLLTATVTNNGCYTAILTTYSTSPANSAVLGGPPLPAVLAPGASVGITASGSVANGEVRAFSWRFQFTTVKSTSAQTRTVSVVVDGT